MAGFSGFTVPDKAGFAFMDPADDVALGAVFEFAGCFGRHGCLVRNTVLWLRIMVRTGTLESTGIMRGEQKIDNS
jgi:hypothetical protein